MLRISGMTVPGVALGHPASWWPDERGSDWADIADIIEFLTMHPDTDGRLCGYVGRFLTSARFPTNTATMDDRHSERRSALKQIRPEDRRAVR
jgi:hypothetical protein